MSPEHGRRALILGVSGRNSVGGALAQALVERGWEVAISCRPAKLAQMRALFEPLGVTHVLGLDALEPATIDDALAQLATQWEQLDALVHCLVSCPPPLLRAPFTALEADAFGEVMEVAVYSLVRACRGAAPMLARSPDARVVTLLSESYRLMTPHYHVLGVAKAALRGAVLYLAQELGPQGILVNAVSFSLVATEGAQRTIGGAVAAGTRAHLAKKAPTGCASSLEDVVETIAYFSGPNCRNVTGQALTVDGGFAQLYF